ncbi:hypothetical protein ESZ53_07260 [Salinibacterium sp. UTAS2018]|uniref:hypothetical protein n=1 Tax=Salinibacterium sp. UTAS2018 TaxID=2508880 RepID=UPI001009474D|nr:hypothetical protein [Salinibacterium sp. UTAS2018]QAV70257.1 hypothetical protein ESZ53_07260 [Salinibacterium sp. UTAS2018]
MTMTRMWNVIGVAAVLLILLLGYVVGVSPALADAVIADEELVAVEAQNQVKTNELAALKALAADSDQLFADLAEAQIAIPGTQLSSEFARQVSNLATSAGATFTELSYSSVTEALAPEAEVAVSAAPEDGGETAEGAEPVAEAEAPAGPTAIQSVPGLVSVGVSIRASGSRSDLLKFINSVQLYQRAFSVTSTNLQAGGDDGGYELDLEGAVYVLSTSGGPLAATGTSGGEVN